MRDIAEIKAEIEKLEFLNGDEPIIANLWLEYYRTLSANIPLDRLQAICEAERDGRCVVLHCKVGDTVYETYFFDGIQEYEVYDIGITLKPKKKRAYCKTIKFDTIGKTVFLTKSEAEQALEGLK